jgi:predicted DNA-binding protein YlxM (UPF0122 family)
MIGNIPSNKGVKMTPEEVLKNKLSQKTKGVLQFDLSGNFIQEHYSLADAAKSVECTKQSIYAAIYGDNKTAKGFRWKYKNKDLVKDQILDNQSVMHSLG